jgi:ketosteroid isomerase-like protein
MARKFFVSIFILLGCIGVFAQSKTDLQKLVETEMAFAAAAEAKGTKAAFLEYLSDDGIIFQPVAKNGKAAWQLRPESPALLAWRPAWADVSSDGRLGYTTGGWEFRPDGKTGNPTAFGEYVTIWQKQEDGSFKAVLDIGIRHEKPADGANLKAAAPQSNSAVAPAAVSPAWKSPPDAGAGEKSVKTEITLNMLTQIYSQKLMSNPLFLHLADDALILREGKMPFVGKSASFREWEKSDRNFPPESYLNFDATLSQKFGNMMYAHGIYKLTHKDKSVNRWNFMQIWKHRSGRWQVVLDILSPIPPDSK